MQLELSSSPPSPDCKGQCRLRWFPRDVAFVVSNMWNSPTDSFQHLSLWKSKTNWTLLLCFNNNYIIHKTLSSSSSLRNGKKIVLRRHRCTSFFQNLPWPRKELRERLYRLGVSTGMGLCHPCCGKLRTKLINKSVCPLETFLARRCGPHLQS